MTPEEKRKEIVSLILCVVIAAAVALCLRIFVFEFVRVEGPSMQPTLYTNELVFMEKISYRSREPERGEVVVCHIEGTVKPVIKRVIGLPGDTVEVKEGAVYMNGEKLSNDIFTGEIFYAMEPVTVPEGCIFVLGDNRNDSKDSHIVGPVPEEDILGRATTCIIPFDKWGELAVELG